MFDRFIIHFIMVSYFYSFTLQSIEHLSIILPSVYSSELRDSLLCPRPPLFLLSILDVR